uniref:Uncharacterized protein n=1 Tax=Gracilinema caldarium TaxID=215591 RepID=A0A7C3I6M2_9SPIR
MAIDKDPSIFTDRSTIGSSDELDEYGVWVKSEPKDVSDTMKTEETAEMSSILDESFEPSLPDIEDLPDLEMDTLSELEPTKADTETSSELSSEIMPDFGNLPEPEDFSVEELPKAEDSKDNFEELTSFDDIDFASFEESSEKQVDTEPFETKEIKQKATSTDEFTELSMDDFLDSDSTGTDTIPEQEQSTDEEPFDIDLEFNESVDLNMMSAENAMDIGTVSEAKDSDLNLETVSDFDDFLSDLGEESEEKSASEEAPAPEIKTEKPADFNDIEAVHQELEAAAVLSEKVQAPTPTHPEARSGSSVDLSTQLLMKIAEELSSIKKELSTLKDELAVYKGSNTPSIQEEKEPGEEKPKGFFDDEEDEKIALTGDELDNILNTAEFTEEAGSVITDVEDTSLLETSEEASESVPAEIAPEPLDESFSLDETEFLSDKEDLISDETLEVEPQAEQVSEIAAEAAQEEQDLVIAEETLLEEQSLEEQVPEIAEEAPLEEISLETAELDLGALQETAAEETLPETAELDTVSLEEAIADEASFEIPEFEPSALDETVSEEVVELPVDESIAELQEEGVKPIIEAPEDVSYLEEELQEVVLHDESATTSDLDLSEAVIEEPDLSGIVLEEHPLEEPSIEDIHIDLDTEEVLHIEDQEASIPETLPSFEELEEMPAPIQEESFEEVLPEGFVVEPEEAEPIEQSQAPAEEEMLEEVPEAEEIVQLEQKESATYSQEKTAVSPDLTQEIKAVLSYMDQLLESLPEEKIEEFAKSEYFETYKKLFEELGLA